MPVAAAASSTSSAGSNAAQSRHVDDALGLQQLETLAANQRKLGSLTGRMTAILSSFDRRLARLERDVRPVHDDLHRLERVQRNIDAVQHSLGKTLSTFDVVVDEEAAVRAGPNPLDLDPYFHTLTRIADGLAYLRSTASQKGDLSDQQQQDRVAAKMHDLLDLGARSLIDDVLLPLLRNQSHRIDPADYIPLGIPLPAPDHHTSAQCQRLLIFLASLPAHPATPNTTPLANAMAQLAEVRAEYLLGSTRFLGTSVREYAVDRIGTASAALRTPGTSSSGMPSSTVGLGASIVSGSGMFAGMANRTEEPSGYVRGSAGVREWLGAWLEMAEVEYNFLAALLDPSSTSAQHRGKVNPDIGASLSAYLRNTFARTLAPSLGFLNSTLAALHSHIRKNLATHTLFLLDIIGVISSDAASASAGEHGDGLDGLDGMMQGIMGSLTRNPLSISIPTRWNYVLSPAKLDVDWLTHIGQHAAASAAGGASSASGAGSQGQGGAGVNSNVALADVSADVLARQAGSMKATATAVLTKFIDDIRHLPLGREQDVPSTGVNEIAYTGVHYIQHMVEYRDVVTPLLHTLGSGNWLMGSSAAPVLTLSGVTGGGRGAPGVVVSPLSQFGAGAQSAAQDEADQREKGRRGDAVLRRYLVDVAACVCEALAVRSKAIRQQSTSSIFLVNNVAYVCNTLSDRSTPLPPTSPLGSAGPHSASHDEGPVLVADFLSTAAEDFFAQTMRQAVARYLDAWAPLVTYLMDDTGSSGGGSGGWKTSYPRGGGGGSSAYDTDKMPTKERFAKFYDTLDDLERLHRAYPVGREDRELRERLRKDVSRMVCPLYTRFVGKHRTSGFSKDPSKHIRMTPQEVEERINAIFR